MIVIGFRCACQVFQVTVEVPFGMFFMVWVGFRCAFEMFPVTVQVSFGTFLHGLDKFKVCL